MRRNEKISTIMTADPATVQVGQPMSDVSRLMQEGGFHHVPVLEGKRLVGIVSSTDILRVSYQYGTDARQTSTVLDHTVALEDLMQKSPTTLSAGSTIRDAVTVLSEGAFNSLPVVDGDSNLVGIVTTTDVLRYMLEQY